MQFRILQWFFVLKHIFKIKTAGDDNNVIRK